MDSAPAGRCWRVIEWKPGLVQARYKPQGREPSLFYTKLSRPFRAGVFSPVMAAIRARAAQIRMRWLATKRRLYATTAATRIIKAISTERPSQ